MHSDEKMHSNKLLFSISFFLRYSGFISLNIFQKHLLKILPNLPNSVENVNKSMFGFTLKIKRELLNFHPKSLANNLAFVRSQYLNMKDSTNIILFLIFQIVNKVCTAWEFSRRLLQKLFERGHRETVKLNNLIEFPILVPPLSSVSSPSMSHDHGCHTSLNPFHDQSEGSHFKTPL